MRSPQQHGEPFPAQAEQPHRPLNSPYLNANEAVQYLRLGSLQALYRLINEHQLPYGRRGRIYLFDTRKIDRWVESSGVVEMVGKRRVG